MGCERREPKDGQEDAQQHHHEESDAGEEGVAILVIFYLSVSPGT